MMTTRLINTSCQPSALGEIVDEIPPVSKQERNRDGISLHQPPAVVSIYSNNKNVPHKQKRVSFDETLNCWYANPHRFQKQRLWHTRKEYQQFRCISTDETVEWMTVDAEQDDDQNSYARVLVRLHQACCSIAATNAASQVQIDTDPQWNRLREVAEARLGLEYVSLPALRLARQERRMRMLKRVTKIQTLFPAHMVEARAEALRDMCQVTSRPSRLLAVHLAQLAVVAPQ